MQKINYTKFSLLSALVFPFFLAFSQPEKVKEPPPSAEPKIIEHGKAIFHAACSPCHGTDGKGDGPIAPNLRSAPDDLTKAECDNRSTASGQLPTDYDLYRSITAGIHNSAMPFFRYMASDDRWAVVQYVKTLSPKFSDPKEYPLDVVDFGQPVPSSPASLAKGRAIYVRMKCADCHGENGKGDGPLATKDVDKHGKQIEAMDLTNFSEYKYCRSVNDVFRIFFSGLSGAHMPSYADKLSIEERWHVANYVWALQNFDEYRNGD